VVVVALNLLREHSDRHRRDRDFCDDAARNTRRGTRGIDFVGLITLSGALFTFVFGLLRGNEKGWTSPLIIGMLLGGLALLVLFVVSQWRGRNPMIDLALFRKPAFTGAQITAFSLSAAVFSMFLYLTLYLQNYLGYSPIQNGTAVPSDHPLVFRVCAVSAKLSGLVPPRFLLAGGLALCAMGLACCTDWRRIPAGRRFCPASCSWAPGLARRIRRSRQRRSASCRRVRPEWRRGRTTRSAKSALRRESRHSGALLEHHIRTTLHVTGAALTYVASGHRPHGDLVVDRVSPAFIGALNEIFVVGGFAAVGAVLALVLVRRGDFAAAAAPAQA
jgi:hypothetical protein